MRDALSAAWQSWTGRIALAASVYVLCFLWAFTTRAGGGDGALILSDFGAVPIEAMAILLALAVVSRERRSGARVAWVLIGLALAANLAGNVLYGAYELAGQEPFPSLADVFYLAFYPLMFVGLLILPTASGTRELFSWRVWSNVAIVILGGGMALLHFVLTPTIEQLTDDVVATVVSLAYPAGDLAILAALATIAARRPYAGDRRALGFFIGALAAWFFADLAFAMASADGTYAPGSAPDLLWLAADVLFLAGAHAHLVGLPKPDADSPTPALSIGRIGPYAMLGVGLLTLIAAAIEPHGELVLLVILAVSLTVIVVLRQLVEERERRSAEAALLAEQASAAAEAAQLARRDPLTRLPNRTSLRETLQAEIAASLLTRRSLTLIFLDLNLFKAVNDNLGHGAGDRLLVEVGRRLQASVRAGDTVARLGGDEFAVVLPGATADTAMAVANRAKLELEKPFMLAGKEIEINAAFGLATYPGGGAHDDDALMHQADTAMYRAKRAHLGPTAYEAAQESVGQGMSELGELRRAIDGDGLELLFQPISKRPDGHIVGVEALVRWRHPSRGLLGASDFVPLATQTGLVRSLDEAVLSLAAAQSVSWRDAGLGIRTSVNVSRQSVQDPVFGDRVRSVLDEYALPGDAIELEMTEDGLIDDPGQAASFVLDMRELGVRMSIDDFGTGFSSLLRLRDLRVSSLKIDRSFVTSALVVPADAAIVEGVVSLGHRLGVEVVAEGVEDEATLAYLDRCGIDYAQGYFIGQPMSADDVTSRLRAARPTPERGRAPHGTEHGGRLAGHAAG